MQDTDSKHLMIGYVRSQQCMLMVTSELCECTIMSVGVNEGVVTPHTDFWTINTEQQKQLFKAMTRQHNKTMII